MSAQLPISLLFLVHLHLLNFPVEDVSVYNEDMFNPTRRGIRERGKTMEDICYFLVSKVEGQATVRKVGIDRDFLFDANRSNSNTDQCNAYFRSYCQPIRVYNHPTRLHFGAR